MSRCFLIIAGFADSLVLFRRDLLAAIAANGWEVHAAAPGLTNAPTACDELQSLGIKVHDVPAQRAGTNPLADLRLTWRLVRLMRETQPDVVLGYTIKPVIYGTVAGWLTRVPHRFALVTGLGYAFTNNRGGALQHLIRRMYRFALRRVDRVIFQNPDDRAFFLDRGVLSDRVSTAIVNGSGVNMDRFARVSVPAGPATFLMICRLLGDKGVREYVAAAAEIRAKYPQVRFQLAGWIDENPDSVSQDELNGWMAEGVVEFLGKLDDVRSALAACTVYVLPSYREGTPRTVLEAMSTGRAIITTDAPGCRETVLNGENGYLVPPRSVEALCQAMQKLIDAPELVAKMGRESRKMCESKYDVHKVNDAMLREMGLRSAGEFGRGEYACASAASVVAKR